MRSVRNACIALLAGIACAAFSASAHRVFPYLAFDSGWAVRAARDLLAGRDPYGYPVNHLTVPYPLPAAFLGLPFAGLADTSVAAAFIVLFVGVFVWAVLRAGEKWRLIMLLSWPFLYSILAVQWTPLICALWFIPELAAVTLIKPQNALPFLLTTKPRKWPLLATAGVLLASLALYPKWPFVWLGQLPTYEGVVPLTYMPWGLLILPALLRWRDRRAWFLLLMACMPQRMVYDQFFVLLIAQNPRQLLALIACSWLPFAAVMQSSNVANVVGTWQLWVVIAHYIPATIVLLWPDLQAVWARRWNARLAPAQ